ncbi:MAG: alkaline phosphatase D family protein [Bacteroidota bacterium]
MLRYLFYFTLFGFLACKNASQPEVTDFGQAPLATVDQFQTLETIAFGSCNHEDLPQPLWDVIGNQNPNLWIWLGDNIYGDTNDMAVMKAKYDKQSSKKEYAAFRQKTPVIGIWDDHDFGLNDGGKEFGPKDQSKQLMFDFLGVSSDAPQRSRAGAHSSYTFGPEGKKVKIILLDARWFRDKIVKVGGVYQSNEEGTVLGKEQWQWFENELKNSDAQVHLIGCGIQMIPEDHRFEKWANFPNERKRLIELLKLEQPKGLILLSGDRHIGEFSSLKDETGVFNIFEITSSGLTHSYEEVGDEPNRHRVGDLTGEKNFGLLHIDWSTSPPQLKVELRGEENQLIATTKVNGE